MTAADDVLAMLAASSRLTLFVEDVTPADDNMVYDGYVAADEAEKIIDVPMPYLVFYSTTPRDNDIRFSGAVGGSVYEWTITGVGETRESAEDILAYARGLLSRKRLNGNLIVRDYANQSVRRDDDYNRPGGDPIFYGVDRFAVGI